jgi:hypothetical protein
MSEYLISSTFSKEPSKTFATFIFSFSPIKGHNHYQKIKNTTKKNINTLQNSVPDIEETVTPLIRAIL